MTDDDDTLPVDRAVNALLRAEDAARDSTPATAAAWAAIGQGWASLAMTSQLRLSALVAEQAALVDLAAAGATSTESVRLLGVLDGRIRKGLGL